MCVSCGVDGVGCGCIVRDLDTLFIEVFKGAVGLACDTFVLKDLVNGKAQGDDLHGGKTRHEPTKQEHGQLTD